ncbi:MAG: transcription termination factor Rho, partial [Flavobacterium sp.]|nr:transcription termination factor Rho [Flavobacterium sp.]
MFDISVLKEMKLAELQEIAKIAKINKYRNLKKDELIYQILDHQATNPEVVKPALKEETPAAEGKVKRARIAKPQRETKKESNPLPVAVKETNVKAEAVIAAPKEAEAIPSEKNKEKATPEVTEPKKENSFTKKKDFQQKQRFTKDNNSKTPAQPQVNR